MTKSSILLLALAFLVLLVQNTAGAHIPRRKELAQVSEDLVCCRFVVADPVASLRTARGASQFQGWSLCIKSTGHGGAGTREQRPRLKSLRFGQATGKYHYARCPRHSHYAREDNSDRAADYSLRHNPNEFL